MILLKDISQKEIDARINSIPMSPQLKLFLQSCLQVIPEKRKNVYEILQLEYLFK